MIGGLIGVGYFAYHQIDKQAVITTLQSLLGLLNIGISELENQMPGDSDSYETLLQQEQSFNQLTISINANASGHLKDSATAIAAQAASIYSSAIHDELSYYSSPVSPWGRLIYV